MASRSFAVGSYLRDVPREESEFDIDARRTLDGLGPSQPEKFEKWTPEMIREAHDGALRADAKIAAKKQGSDAFAELYPQYLDTQANGESMARTLNAMFGDVAYTVEQFEAAFNVLCANNGLELDQAEIVKQQQAAANQRAKAARARRAAEARVYTEKELGEMSVEELREHANREMQKDFQAAGERGGNGF